MALGFKQQICPHLAQVCLFLDLTVLELSAESLRPLKISARFFLKVARPFGMSVAMRSACIKFAWFSSLLSLLRTHLVCLFLKWSITSENFTATSEKHKLKNSKAWYCSLIDWTFVELSFSMVYLAFLTRAFNSKIVESGNMLMLSKNAWESGTV